MKGREDYICPICGRDFSEAPALSRKDGKTMICPDCGIAEALDAMNSAAEEAAKEIYDFTEDVEEKTALSCSACKAPLIAEIESLERKNKQLEQANNIAIKVLKAIARMDSERGEIAFDCFKAAKDALKVLGENLDA